MQATNVLLFNPDYASVREEQRQQVEFSRDIVKRNNDICCAQRERNSSNGPHLPMIEGVARIMALGDASTKMSKSAGNEGSSVNIADVS